MTKKREPIRTCVGCRERRPAQVLLRVRFSDGQLILDRDRAGSPLGGRGAWLCADTRSVCVAKATKTRAFDRAFRARIPAAVAAELARRLDGSNRVDRNDDGATGNGGRLANRR